MAFTVCKMFLWFIIYSFIGWVYESTLCSITSRSLVNRGFLNGPVCPVYGFGALIVILALEDQAGHVLALFLSSMLLTAVLEYFTSWILEKFFHAKWWDYSKWRFNLNGRICLGGALVFGILSVLLIEFVHPVVSGLVEKLSRTAVYWASAVLLVMMATDLFATVRHLLTLNGRLAEIQAALDGYKDEMAQRRRERVDALQAKLEAIPDLDAFRTAFQEKLGVLPDQDELRERIQERLEGMQSRLEERFENSRFHSQRIQQLLDTRSFQDRRLLKAFPKWRSTSYAEAHEKLRERLDPRRKDASSTPQQDPKTEEKE